jgi:hypothetical protein
VATKKKGATLKQEVERQSARLRLLADELTRHADSMLFTGGRASLIRGWAAVLVGISEELTEAVQEKDGRLVSGISKAGAGAIAVLLYFAPTANGVAQEVFDRYAFPETVMEHLDEAVSGFVAIEQALAASSTTDPVDDPATDLRQLVAYEMTRLVHTSDAFRRWLSSPSPNGHSPVDVAPDQSIPNAWNLYPTDIEMGQVGPITLPAGFVLSEVREQVNRWIEADFARRADEAAQDQYTQDLIDRARGK